MRVLIADIELDIQELKCLMNAFLHEPNETMREILKRNILQMRDRLDQMLQNLDATVQNADKEEIQCMHTKGNSVLEDANPTFIETELNQTETKSLQMEILGEYIRPITDLRHSISLNDSFRFSRELFSGDNELMNKVIGQISEMSSVNMALAFLHTKIKVAEKNEALDDFVELIKKYFN